MAGISSLLASQTTQSNAAPTVPKAFINFIFFDEQFKAVCGGFSQVNPAGGLIDHHNDSKMQNINVPKNGFVYIYCSNESPVNVFFDNVQVTQTRSPILEETHYYPFGLAMAGISSKAAGKLQNKYGITGKEKQSQEFSDGTGLEEYDFGARFYDQQLARFSTVDPHVANYYWLSPYSYCNNNPLKYLDPSGMDPETSTLEKPKDLSNVTVAAHSSNNSLANRGLPWANSAAAPGAKHAMNQQQVYQQARGNGFSQTELTNAWKKQGVNDGELERFERGYKAEVDYKNMSLIAVGSIGAPILAIGGIETGAISYLVTGIKMTTASRIAIGGVDAVYQLANTGKVNWIQSVGAQFGPLTYALTSNTTFEYSSFTFGINPDATVQSTILATAFNIGGTEILRVSDGGGVGAAAGAVSSIPGIIGDQINNGIK